MSSWVFAEVIRTSRSRLGTRLLLLALGDSAGDDGMLDARLARLMEWTYLSLEEVHEAIQDAVQLGELEVLANRGDAMRFLVMPGVRR